MALARLTKQCHECPFVETCEHKEMEALGYLPESIMADVKVPERQLSDLQTEYHEKLSKLENENDSLKESCRVLCNRCFTLTRGVTCLFCGLDYPCPHMPGLEEQVAMAHKLRKEIEKKWLMGIVMLLFSK